MSQPLFRLSSKILETKVDAEIILMSTENGYYYGLEPVGSRIWEIVSIDPVSLNEICQKLMLEYEVSEADCQRETLIFLENLVEQGLIEKTLG